MVDDYNVEPQRPGESLEEVQERFNEAIRKARGWPQNVSSLATGRIERLGINPDTGELYWDGQPVVTKHALERREYFLAFIAAWGTAAGAIIAAAAFAVDVFKG